MLRLTSASTGVEAKAELGNNPEIAQ